MTQTGKSSQLFHLLTFTSGTIRLLAELIACLVDIVLSMLHGTRMLRMLLNKVRVIFLNKSVCSRFHTHSSVHHQSNGRNTGLLDNLLPQR